MWIEKHTTHDIATTAWIRSGIWYSVSLHISIPISQTLTKICIVFYSEWISPQTNEIFIENHFFGGIFLLRYRFVIGYHPKHICGAPTELMIPAFCASFPIHNLNMQSECELKMWNLSKNWSEWCWSTWNDNKMNRRISICKCNRIVMTIGKIMQ